MDLQACRVRLSRQSHLSVSPLTSPPTYILPEYCTRTPTSPMCMSVASPLIP